MGLKRTVLCFAVAIVSFWGTQAYGQLTSGNITGSIFDPTGAIVPGATIVAKNNATNVAKTTTSTSKGDYRFENLPVGSYTLTVTAPGFAQKQVGNVVVQLNTTVTSNVTLNVGQATTTIQVSEAATQIDTTTAQVQTTYQTQAILQLPAATGGQADTGVLNLSLLNAGVTTSGGTGYGEGPSVGGQRPTNNNFTVEGIDNNSLAVTGPIVTVPADAVAEFSVLQNQFSPDFGHSSGGQFNQVVKSGTNQFHGEAYEYFQNRNLDAADNLNAEQGTPLHPRFDDNRFGGNFGGPIKRNKLFFFGDYEYNPIGQTAPPIAYFVPTAAGYTTLASLPGINQTNLAEFQKYLGTATTAVPASTLPNGAPILVAPGPGSNESLGTGVFSPTSTVAPLSIPVGQISAQPPSYTNNEYGVGSIDYNLSEKDSMRGRFILNRTGSVDNSGFPSVFYGVTPVNSYLATFSEYHTFTPSLLNEFRLGFNRQNQTFPNFGNQSFPGLDSFPNINVYELNAAFGPDMNAPQYTIQNLYQLTDNVTWVKGNHSFKFGFDGWSSISPSQFIQRSRGDYEWTYLSDYLYDNNPDGIAQRSVGDATYYQNQQLLGFFANDNWKITPNLTVNLGLRYEYLTFPLSENTQDLNASASVPGLIVFKSPTTQKTNFMPRIGIAYSPGTSGTTSIRAGFGITYDVLYDNLGTLSLPPQLTSTVDVTGLNATGFLAGGGIPPNAAVAEPEGMDARAETGGFIPDQKRPEAYNWNFGIQHVFAQKYTFSTRYVGTRGLFLPMQLQLNLEPTVTPSTALPVYFTAPSQAMLNSLPSTLANLTDLYNNGNNGNGGFFVPAYANAGFTSIITAFMPTGNSIYHSWVSELSRQFSNGMQFDVNYTWSHNIDNSTDALDSTVLAPRRPQNSQDLHPERASSVLDHRNRFVAYMIYDMPYFKHSNWFLKNIVGNWQISPVYTFQSGQWATPQSGVDSNLNLDSAPDRVMINPAGSSNVGSDASPLTNSAGDTVAYLANNPNARFVTAPKGTLPNGGRSLIALDPINDIDVTFGKRFNFTETKSFSLSAQFLNVLNHPQYVGGYLDDVFPFGYAQGDIGGDLLRSALEPKSTNFQQWSQVLSSNPRMITITAKFVF